METRIVGTARQWSSEACVSDHVDLQATAMDLDTVTGTSVLLAGKKCLALIDISPESTPRLELKYKRTRIQSRWDVNQLQFRRNDTQMAALASQNIVEVLRIEESSVQILATLRGHCRIISDLDWSQDHLLASSSVDTLVNLWDVRVPLHSALSLNCIVPVGLVKCGKCPSDQHLILTSHEGDLKVWDLRKPHLPLHYISAHVGRILSVDWHPSESSRVVSSGRECTLKFFDIGNNCKQAHRDTAMPIWRAKFTPFKHALATVILPQTRSSDNSLFLWDTRHLEYPVHCFYGHRDVILNFGWRQVDNSDLFQMVTWSRDHTLRVWHVDSRLQRLCSDEEASENSSEHSSPVNRPKNGDDPDNTLTPNMGQGLATKLLENSRDSLKDAAPNTKTEVEVQSETHVSVSTELCRALLAAELEECQRHCNQHRSLVNISQVSLEQRTCRLTLNPPWQQATTLNIRVNFPKDYPCQGRPRLSVDRDCCLDPSSRSRLTKHLKSITANVLQQVVRKETQNSNNMTMIVDALANLPPLLTPQGSFHDKGGSDGIEHNNNNGRDKYDGLVGGGWGHSNLLMAFPAEMHFDSSNVPAARTCGAMFAANDFLVCFGTHKRASRRSVPRFSAPPFPSGSPDVISSVVQGRFKVRPVHDDTKESTNKAYTRRQYEICDHSRPLSKAETSVHVLNVARLSPFKRALAKSYVLMPCSPSSSLSSLFATNARLAHRHLPRRPDVARLWLLCGQMAEQKVPRGEHHPLGKAMFGSVMEHLVSIGDSQTLVSILCLLAQVQDNNNEKNKQSKENKESKERLENDMVSKEPMVDVRRSRSHKLWLPKSLREQVSPILEHSSSAYHTIHLTKSVLKSESDLERFVISPPSRGVRSNSWSNASIIFAKNMFDDNNGHDDHHVAKRSMVQSLCQDMDLRPVIRHYIGVLTHYCLLDKRAEVMKLLDKIECDGHFRRHQRRRVRRECPICRLPIKGLAALCPLCGHGGHVEHWRLWFATHITCPLPNCNCQCLNFGQIP